MSILKNIDNSGSGISEDDLRRYLLSSVVDMFENAYDTPIVQQRRETVIAGDLNLDAQYFIQEIPERRGGIADRFMKLRALTVQHNAYFIVHEGDTAFIWVNYPIEDDGSLPGQSGRENAAEERIDRFIASFRMHVDK